MSEEFKNQTESNEVPVSEEPITEACVPEEPILDEPASEEPPQEFSIPDGPTTDGDSPDKGKNKSRRKWLGITVAVLLVIGLSIGFGRLPFSRQLSVWGNQALTAEQSDLAKGCFQWAIRIAPSIPNGYMGLSSVYIQEKQFNQAESILREGLAHVKDTAETVQLYHALIEAYTTAGKGKSALQHLNDEAFDATGKREFGARYEEAIQTYLRRIGKFRTTAAIVPAFETADQIDPNWLISAFSWKTDDAPKFSYNTRSYIGRYPEAALEDVRVNATRYFNPDITLSDDGAYAPYIGDLAIEYEPKTQFILNRGKGNLDYITDDFIVTDFYKADGEYHIEGVFLGLLGADETYYKTNTAKCHVFVDYIGTDIGRSIGTASVAINGNAWEDTTDDSIQYDFDLSTLDTPICHYVLKDNPDGGTPNASSSQKENVSNKGPFMLMSRTPGASLSEIGYESKTLDFEGMPDTEAVALEKYAEIFDIYRELQANGKSSNSLVQRDLAQYGAKAPLKYLLKDFNGDGSPELFIATEEGDQVTTGTMNHHIYDAYTLDNMGNVSKLFGQDNAIGVRSRYVICKGDKFYNEGSGGAMLHNYTLYELPANAARASVVDGYINDNNKIYKLDYTPSNQADFDAFMSDVTTNYPVDNDLDWKNL